MQADSGGTISARRIEMRVPAILSPGQSGGAIIRAGGSWREVDSLREIEIAGSAWGRSAPVRRIPLADTSANADRRAQLHAEVSVLAPDFSIPVQAGKSLRVTLAARNAGSTVWLNNAIGSELQPRRGDVAAILRWERAETSVPLGPSVGDETAAGTLLVEQPVHPGETVRLDGVVSAPRQKGRYLLRVDLVCQSVGWFSEVGPTRKIEMPVVVE